MLGEQIKREKMGLSFSQDGRASMRNSQRVSWYKVCLVYTQDLETETLVISHLPISARINTIPNKIQLDKKVFSSLASRDPKDDTVVVAVPESMEPR